MKNKGLGRIKPHQPRFTKWRKNKGQFVRKDYQKELPDKIAEYFGKKESIA